MPHGFLSVSPNARRTLRRLVTLAGGSPQIQRLFRDHVQIRFPPVGVRGDQALPSAGGFELEKSFAAHREVAAPTPLLPATAAAFRPDPSTSAACPFCWAPLRSSTYESTVRLTGCSAPPPLKYAADCCTKGTHAACNGRSLEILSNVEVNTSTLPSPTCRSSTSGV